MKIKIIKEQEMCTNVWSGGKTTEMMIYPQDASYEKRNFKFRISSATVEEEKSVFSNLSGIQRYLTVLDGEVTLNTDGKEIVLAPYDTIVFDGGKKTTSKGKCVDFNLMLKNCEGFLEVLSGKGEYICNVDKNRFCMFYTKESGFRIKYEEEVYRIPANSLFVAEGDGEFMKKLTVMMDDICHIIHIDVEK